MELSLLRAQAHSPSYFSLLRGSSGQLAPVDFCIPCNPYFPTPEIFEHLGRNLETILKYYPSDADTITAELCATLGLHPKTVAMGNGSTELITWIDHLLVTESLAVPIPTFGRWTDQPMETGKRVDMYPLVESRNFGLDVDDFVRFVRMRGSRVAVICNPNNPDGGYLPQHEVLRLLDLLIDLDLVIVDESFLRLRRRRAVPGRADGGRGPAQRDRAAQPGQELRAARHPLRLHGRQPGAGREGSATPAQVEPQLLRRGRGVHDEAVPARVPESLRGSPRTGAAMFHQLSALPELTVYASQGNFLLVKLPPGTTGCRCATTCSPSTACTSASAATSWARPASSFAWWSGRRRTYGDYWSA